MTDQDSNYAMAAACRVIWPEAMENCNATEMILRCETMKKAFDAAFATGAVGMYVKARGVPKPVDERIMIWLEVCCDQVSKIKAAENTISKRLVLTTLYNLADSAEHAVRDARKHNGKK